MKLCVPGRICLFGEHTDWAGGYRRINPALEKGYCLITGTDQHLTAEVTSHDSDLVLTSTLNDGTRHGPVQIPMTADALRDTALRGGFFSYAAGTAYEILRRYDVRGLELNNTHTDLPVKKGLSSSAAVCVLTARAFNRVYNLNLSIRDEMELAYRGEILTGSQCGRMDQGCAYGRRPILMTFDGDALDVRELIVGADLHFLIVDLCAAKDTRTILRALNQCYPFAETPLHRAVRKYLGPASAGITREAVNALERGDAEAIGDLMTRVQDAFDTHVAPVCPSELTAPVLHRVLTHKPIQKYILGGKGVGSQGDGSAQFITADAAARRTVIDIIQRDFGMPCLELTMKATPSAAAPPSGDTEKSTGLSEQISVRHPAQRKTTPTEFQAAGNSVRKAVIPAAGHGVRLFPATKTLKKEMFPVIDRQGRIKPAIMAIVEEAVEAGIESVCLVVQASDRPVFEGFFHQPPPRNVHSRLSPEQRDTAERIHDLGRRITLIEQTVQDGFGHAVHCARDWVAGEPFLLMLGDHLYDSRGPVSCARQVLETYDGSAGGVVGLTPVPGETIHRFGCAAGTWREPGKILSLTAFHEKPDPSYARKHLRVDGLPEDHFLSLFGMYVLTSRIFAFLDEHIRKDVRESGEIQLTTCLERQRRADGFIGRMIQGRRFDIGMPDSYRNAVLHFEKDSLF